MATIGHIDGYPEGTLFLTRADLNASGVHRPPMAGICGTEHHGAESILLSGGYEDDEDSGDSILYTGQGGNDPLTKKQFADQALTRGNAALATSKRKGLPVRVVRGSKHKAKYVDAPDDGYRYDGLFQVTECRQETGKSGFKIWRFRLIKITLTQ